MGLCFGSAYARFQDCMWQLLPTNVDTANAMGFCTLTRLLGGAVGNVIAGLILDLLQNSNEADLSDTANIIAYNPSGYIVVCTGCTGLAILAGFLVLKIPGRALEAQVLAEGKKASAAQKA